MRPSKICCDRLDAHLVAAKCSTICSGEGEQPLLMTVENFLRLTERSFSSVEVFEDCSGGNSRLSYLLGCGGRYFFSLWIVFGLRCVSGTEEHLMAALNVLFGNQVVEADQFASCALAALIS